MARAPGRLDVMGGIADFSGSLVLQMPIALAAHVALQLHDVDQQPTWKHVQACYTQEPCALHASLTTALTMLICHRPATRGLVPEQQCAWYRYMQMQVTARLPLTWTCVTCWMPMEHP